MTRLITFLLAALALSTTADAQAYCGLRDPNKQIYRLFPEAKSFRSIVRTVDKDARREVAERLPFTLHFNELGRHTLYVVQGEGAVLGFVHVRSEAGRWGLVEVAWALDLDLRVVGFEFQRCRDRSKRILETEAFRTQLEGRDFDSLRSLMNRRADGLVESALAVDGRARDLAVVVVRNGLKTIAATESTWREDVWTMRAQRFAAEAEPLARSLRPIEDLYSEAALDALDAAIGEEGSGIVRESALAWDLVCEQGSTLKHVFVARWQQDDLCADVLWFIGPDGNVTSIEPQGRWARPEVKRAFRAQIGRDVDTLCDCGGAVELAAYEVLVTLGAHSEASSR